MSDVGCGILCSACCSCLDTRNRRAAKVHDAPSQQQMQVQAPPPKIELAVGDVVEVEATDCRSDAKIDFTDSASNQLVAHWSFRRREKVVVRNSKSADGSWLAEQRAGGWPNFVHNTICELRIYPHHIEMHLDGQHLSDFDFKYPSGISPTHVCSRHDIVVRKGVVAKTPAVTEAAYKELLELNLGELRKRALAAGATEEEVDNADAKKRLVDIVLQKEAQKAAQASNKERKELLELSLGELRKIAMAAGATEKDVDNAENKQELVDIVVMKQVQKAADAPAKEPKVEVTPSAPDVDPPK